MKLSDYVIHFLAERGVTHFYGMSGGAAVHLFHSIAQNPATSYVCVSHEQSAALAADGYARATGKLGVALTTSGPGATNLLTGTCSSYYDSVPTMMLTGQVATHRLKGNLKVRQIGFQETDVVSIFNTVTKYAVQILDPKTIRYHLEKAYYLAFSGRPGPVLIDIPDDLQRANIEPSEIPSFQPEQETPQVETLALSLEKLNRLLAEAQRPVLVLGGGLKTPPVPKDVVAQFVTRLGIPVLLTWAGIDLLSSNHPLWAGPFGVYGPRPGNYAVQNSDLVICIGTRLSQNMTGGLLHTFAREAKLVMVDIDPAEMDKFAGRGINLHQKIHAGAADFISASTALAPFPSTRLKPWLQRIEAWLREMPVTEERVPAPPKGTIDAYAFVRALADVAADDELIFVDTGGNLTWTCNGWKTRGSQRLHSAWNNTPMGYALPAAIGAAFSRRPNSTTCLIGDGGLMLCLGELATVKYHQLPLRIFLFNNHCHGIQRQTLETWFDGQYEAVDPGSGLAFVDFVRVAQAMDLPVITLSNPEELPGKLKEIYQATGPIFVNVEINPNQKLYPVLKFGAALENQLPAMSPETVASSMVIKPYLG